MTTTAPKALWGMYKLLGPYLTSLKIGGIVGDTRHVAGGGYHISRDDLKNHGQGGDYSIQAPADKRGGGTYSAAIDITLNQAEMVTVSKRLRAAMTADAKGNYDDRIEPLREFIGTVDNRNVCGFNRYQTGRRTGWYPSGYSESSHLWHVHLSFFRAYANDANAVAGVAEVVAGLKAGALGWRNPDSPPAKPTPSDNPTPPEPTPVPTPPPPPSVIASPKLKVELDAPGAGNWQGAVQNRKTGHWYIAEAQVIDGEDREDCLLHHFTASGTYLDSMRLTPATGYRLHATSFGVSDDDIIWVTWNEDVNDVVTLQYVPGATIHKADCQAMHVFNDGNVQVGFSPTRDWVAVRQIKKDSEVYTRYSKQNVLDGTDTPYGVQVIVPRRDDRTVQGFTLIKTTLYVLTGRPSLKQPTVVERYSFDTGKLIDTVTLTLPGEPEGMDGRYLGTKVATGAKRRLRIFAHNL